MSGRRRAGSSPVSPVSPGRSGSGGSVSRQGGPCRWACRPGHALSDEFRPHDPDEDERIRRCSTTSLVSSPIRPQASMLSRGKASMSTRSSVVITRRPGGRAGVPGSAEDADAGLEVLPCPSPLREKHQREGRFLNFTHRASPTRSAALRHATVLLDPRRRTWT